MSLHFAEGEMLTLEQFAPPTENKGILPDEDLRQIHLAHKVLMELDSGFGSALRITDEEADADAQKKHERDSGLAYVQRIEQRIADLMIGMDEARKNVDNNSQYKEAAETIQLHKNRAHEIMTENNWSYDDPQQWMEAVGQAFPKGILVVSDMDLTLTDAAHLNHIPASAFAETLMDEYGREVFPEAFVRAWEPMLEMRPEIFARVGSKTPIREGVREFIAFAVEQGIPLNILSANFLPLVEAFAAQLGLDNFEEIHAVNASDVTATDKATKIRKIAYEHPDHAVVYCGDGGSDLPAMNTEARKVVVLYCALKDGSFEKALKNEKLRHIGYESFHDVVRVLPRKGKSTQREPLPAVA